MRTGGDGDGTGLELAVSPKRRPATWQLLQSLPASTQLLLLAMGLQSLVWVALFIAGLVVSVAQIPLATLSVVQQLLTGQLKQAKRNSCTHRPTSSSAVTVYTCLERHNGPGLSSPTSSNAVRLPAGLCLGGRLRSRTAPAACCRTGSTSKLCPCHHARCVHQKRLAGCRQYSIWCAVLCAASCLPGEHYAPAAGGTGH